jgi:hypothetical protein
LAYSPAWLIDCVSQCEILAGVGARFSPDDNYTRDFAPDLAAFGIVGGFFNVLFCPV